jgi:Flp pilus assembly pilin Flp
MTKFLTGFLNKESGTASVTFALLAASVSIIAMGAVKLLGSKIGFIDCGIHDALHHIQVYRFAWDASNVQLSSRLQQNERYYVSDPVGSLSQDDLTSTVVSLLASVKHGLTAG